MNARFSLLAAAIVSSLLATHSGAATESLFTENFDGNTSGKWSSVSGAPLFENAEWTYTTAYKAYYAIRMGSTSTAGSATTPEISLKTGWSGATVTVTFQSAAWYGSTSGLTLSKIENGTKTTIDAWSVPQIAATKDAADAITDFSSFTSDANNKPYSVSFDVYGPFQLVFETIGSGDNRRAYLDSVSVVGEESVSPPAVTVTGVSSSFVTISWPAQATAEGYAVRAWTLVPVNEVTENFAGYPDDPPAGWTFNNLSHDARYADEPIAFDKAKTVSMWMSSPKYDADISSVSFQLRANSASSSTLVLSGSPDGETWTDIDSWTGDNLKGSGVTKTTTVTTLGVRYLKWTFEKDSGNVFIGHVSVNGTGVGKQPSYLTGYGPDATAVAGTSVTISNPVAGETNYIEVTATGLSGKTASATIAVPVPAVTTPKPAVISVK